MPAGEGEQDEEANALPKLDRVSLRSTLPGDFLLTRGQGWHSVPSPLFFSCLLLIEAPALKEPSPPQVDRILDGWDLFSSVLFPGSEWHRGRLPCSSSNPGQFHWTTKAFSSVLRCRVRAPCPYNPWNISLRWGLARLPVPFACLRWGTHVTFFAVPFL